MILIKNAVINRKIGNTKVSNYIRGMIEEYYRDSQQILIRCCIDTTIISNTIAIETITMITEREVKVAIDQIL